MRKAGFWFSKYEPLFPKPRPESGDSNWVREKDNIEFAKMLQALESKAKVKGFKGSSKCRICGCRNGSREYHYKGWLWPEGFIHYILKHNVKPPEGFIRFVLREAKQQDVNKHRINNAPRR